MGKIINLHESNMQKQQMQGKPLEQLVKCKLNIKSPSWISLSPSISLFLSHFYGCHRLTIILWVHF